ncbi:MAG: tetratricopeptide repeat protein [Rhizomicrobium sp.]
MNRARKHLFAGAAVLALCAIWAPPVLADDDAPAASATAASPDVNSEIARAQALRKDGKLPEAASVLAQLMLVTPDDARIVGEYGKVMAEEKRGDDALAFLKRAVELNTNDWTLYSALGVAYDENNNPKDAAAAYQRALAMKPGEPTVLNNYAMSRLLAGDYTGAQMMFEQIQNSHDPRIANNAAMAAEIVASHVPAASRPAASRPVARSQAVAAAPKYTPPAAAPVKTQELALSAPHPAKTPSPAAHAATSSTGGATAAPRAMVAADGSRVIMQAVPKDPLAGPVKPKAAPAPHRTAVASRKAIADAPALRTAADTH